MSEQIQTRDLNNQSKEYHDLKKIAPKTADMIEKNAMVMLEIQTRVLTAFSIIKEREKVTKG